MLAKRLIKACHYIVNILFGAIIIYLWLLCGFSTCYMSLSEHTYFVKDSFGINIIIAGVFCMALLLLSKSENIRNKLCMIENEAFFAKIERMLFALILVEGLIVIFSFRTIPRADQSDVMFAANALKNGDYTPFQTGGYISNFPNQIGLLWFWYILSFVFGNNNYIVFQFINVIAIVLIYKQLSDISEILKLTRICRTSILLFGTLYFPVLLYSTFAYGNIIAQMLILISLKYEMIFMQRPKIRNIVISSIFLMLSIAIKENNLIFAIAMIIYAVMKFLEINERKILILIVCIIAGTILQGCFLENLLEAKTGEQIGGMSMWSFVAMGLHENEGLCDGWWDNSTAITYEESGYNSDQQKKIAIADIQNRLEEFEEDKEYAFRFFARKIASQWNNPTFQCFWINQVCGSDIEHSKLVNKILSVQNSDKMTRVLDIIQFLILTGIIFSILLTKESNEYTLIKVIFIGGFLFHIAWEAKGQYTLPYFLLMIPLSLDGYNSLLTCGQRGNTLENVVDLDRKRNKLLPYILGVMIILILLMNNRFINNTIKLDFDAEAYQQYVYNNTTDKFKDGLYNIKVYNNPQLIISYSTSGSDSDDGAVLIDTFKEDLRGNIRLQDIGERAHICFADSKYGLDLDMNDEQKGFVHAYLKNNNESQHWYLKKAEGEQDTYYIIKGNGALTYDEENETVRLDRRDYSDLQKWIIE